MTISLNMYGSVVGRATVAVASSHKPPPFPSHSAQAKLYVRPATYRMPCSSAQSFPSSGIARSSSSGRRLMACCALTGRGNNAPREPEDSDEEFIDNDLNVDSFRSTLQARWHEETEANLTERIDDSIKKAKNTCRKNPTMNTWNDCAIAWEEVDELSIAKERKQFEWEKMRKPVLEEKPKQPVLNSKGRSWNKGEKVVPKDSAARRLMETEMMPCSDDKDCELPSGSFLKAAKYERAFGANTRAQFEQMFKDSLNGELPNPKKKTNKDDDSSA